MNREQVIQAARELSKLDKEKVEFVMQGTRNPNQFAVQFSSEKFGKYTVRVGEQTTPEYFVVMH